jgi:hypothetical protein
MNQTLPAYGTYGGAPIHKESVNSIVQGLGEDDSYCYTDPNERGSSPLR